MQSWRVSHIIQLDNWWMRDDFLQPVWHIIQSQQVPNSASVISDNGSGQAQGGLFTFSSAWVVVRLLTGAVIRSQFQFVNMIWYPNNNPKMSICLLRTLQGKLLTRAFLTQLGIAKSDLCLLCKENAEDMDHLFFACPFSAYILEFVQT